MLNIYSKKTIGLILVCIAVVIVGVVSYWVAFRVEPKIVMQKPKFFEAEQYKYPFFAEMTNQLIDRLNQ